MQRTKNKALLAKGRGRTLLSLLLVGVLTGSVGAQSAMAGSKKKDPGTCALSQSATGNLVATGSGLTGSASFQYEIYSAPQASVGGGQLSTDASGSFSDVLDPLSFYMNVYPNETTLTFDLYPIIGNKADMSTVVASCQYV